MTMTPTPEGKQLAADLANATLGSDRCWASHHFDDPQTAQGKALARLATEHLALKEQVAAKDARLEEALADLREIDAFAEQHGFAATSKEFFLNRIAAIAAKYRVETDPLVEAIESQIGGKWSASELAKRIRAELSKRGYEIGGKS